MIGPQSCQRMMSVGALAFCMLSTPALSADRTQPVDFPEGRSSVVLKGRIKGYDGIRYSFDAKSAQALSILFSPGNRSCYFNLRGPDSEEALFNGSMTGNEYSGSVSKTGTYIVQVYLMRNAARRNEACRYSLTIKRSG